MDKTLKNFTGIMSQKRNISIGVLCLFSIIAGLCVMAICSSFIINVYWHEIFSAVILIFGVALLFSLRLLGRVLSK